LDAERIERLNLAQPGRRMAGPTPVKAAIKRARRFTGNGDHQVADAMACVVARLARRCK
jgi:hypothetical protein